MHRLPTLLLAVALVAPVAVADSRTFVSVLDNTLIEDPQGAYSGGKSTYFFVGRVGTNGGGTLRRGLVRFDLGAIPPGSTIESASIRLYCSAAGTTAQHPISFKRALASWGEGTSIAFGGGGANSTAGDATWLHRFWPGTPWAVPGGDFAATASATRNVGGQGFYTWTSTPGLVADVQLWVDDASANHGWLLQGNESVQQSVKRFDSRESLASTRPQLTVVFTPPPPPVIGDLNGDQTVNAADLAILLGQWGGPGTADFDGNGTVNAADLATLLGAWSS